MSLGAVPFIRRVKDPAAALRLADEGCETSRRRRLEGRQLARSTMCSFLSDEIKDVVHFTTYVTRLRH